ncbi:hypothetical protein LY28_01764 [Ruminiclostridium sufflavum DSM 19573]|uniref:Uncharacterized protein n=1 Tax=Ruminiclostridium sufflavum DSM 19573 TaxID=1121337 RepID=A0A318XM85_9FIRM|nr:NusG domain II-containing protein [Ruminiclostridium sufflavum]PYG87744.1 hypothetical protein LY28_01764 [Ruminiclostridium sufflavum DSM 19573]
MKFFRKTDVLIIAGIAAVSFAMWAVYKYNNPGKPAEAEIYYKSELAATIDLNTGTDRQFSIPQNKNVIFYLEKDGSIGFVESDCPDKICIRTGRLKNIGETAACLPNEIILKIVPVKARSDDDIDMVAGK